MIDYSRNLVATQKHLTSILIPKILHERLKTMVRIKGTTIQGIVALQLGNYITREETRRKRNAAC